MNKKIRLILAALALGTFVYIGIIGFGYVNFVNLKEQQHAVKKTSVPEFKSGDIIFQISMSRQSKAIQLATKSKYSHVGLIYKEGTKLFVYEAVQPVQTTPLADWIKRGKNGHYVVKRLKNASEILTLEKLSQMKEIGEKYRDKNYDIYFEWSDDRLYCSELVWKIYKEAMGIEIGALVSLTDFDLSSKIVKTIMTERYGNNIPLNEQVISPGAMFDSSLLKTIYQN